MRRWLVRICVLLVLGAIVNVAVAWGTALRLPAPVRPETTAEMPYKDGLLTIQHRPGEVRVTAHRRRRSFLTMREIDQSEFSRILPQGSVFHDLSWIDDQLAAAMALGGTGMFIEHSHGWPIVAMTGWMNVALLVNRTSSVVAQRGVKEIGPLSLGPFSTVPHYRRLLPLHPIWPGFAINTVFYAVVLWLLFAGPFVVRRWRRIRRGLCPKCAYDLRGTPRGADATACPECGTTSF